METNLTYDPLTKSELETAGSIFYGILTNPRIMDTVDDFHLAGMRCAVIVAQNGGVLEKVLVRAQRSVTQDFPFDEIAGIIANYDIRKHVCIVLVRDSAVCSVLVERVEA
jgi:hypothetical protein